MSEKHLDRGEPDDSIRPGALPSSSIEPDTSSAHSSDLDDNYAIYQQNAGQEIDPAEAKKVLRKIDGVVLPILFVIYFLQYIDKNAINFASVYGLEEGTNLHGQEYSWLATIFYFGKMTILYPADPLPALTGAQVILLHSSPPAMPSRGFPSAKSSV